MDTDSIDALKGNFRNQTLFYYLLRKICFKILLLDKALTDLLHWKQSGFSGSSFSIKCRSIRIGSYSQSLRVAMDGFIKRARLRRGNGQQSR